VFVFLTAFQKTDNRTRENAKQNEEDGGKKGRQSRE
jgi:hypothetical protein